MAQTPPTPPPEPKKHLFTEEIREAKEKDREEESRPKPSMFSEMDGGVKLKILGAVVLVIVVLVRLLFGCNSPLFE